MASQPSMLVVILYIPIAMNLHGIITSPKCVLCQAPEPITNWCPVALIKEGITGHMIRYHAIPMATRAA